MASIHIKNVHQDRNKLDADFVCSGLRSGLPAETIKSSQIIICNVISVQVMIKYYVIHGYVDCVKYFYVRQLKKPGNLLYECKVGKRSSNDHNLVITASSGGTYMLYETTFCKIPQTCQLSFGLSFQIGLLPSPNPIFSTLYDHEDIPDFKLCCIDGAITVHRLILEVHSPVFKTMLTGMWKETNEGHVNVAGTSVQTLEHLKKYLYLDQLPDDNADLEPLLALSSVYKMKVLAQKCSAKLLLNITADNALHFIQLATQYKIKYLITGALKFCYSFHSDLLSYCEDNEWI